MTNVAFSPLREVLRTLTEGHAPGEWLNGITRESELDEAGRERLLEWASDHANPNFLTGAALLDQADVLVTLFFTKD